MSHIAKALIPTIFDDCYRVCTAQSDAKLTIEGHTKKLSKHQAVAVVVCRIAVAAIALTLFYSLKERRADLLVPLGLASSAFSMPGAALALGFGGTAHNAFKAVSILRQKGRSTLVIEPLVKIAVAYLVANSYGKFDMMRIAEEMIIQRLT